MRASTSLSGIGQSQQTVQFARPVTEVDHRMQNREVASLTPTEANIERVAIDTLSSSESPDLLRADMVARLQERESIRSPQVAEAFAKVPRERFAPEASPSAAYAVFDTVVTKRNATGKATSSISAPWLQAEMLEAAQLKPGERVLEIGSGGYNAALIAEIVGPEGLVVTVDIDPFVTERATRFLTETGYPHVTVVLGDAEHAAGEFRAYDAILVTVGAPGPRLECGMTGWPQRMQSAA
ncbi:class I SAM-dependent methyltransferase [Nonomuraea turcica]|uniref:hypothetical protein n=1 Tax=Nonomuraea sp. G32 TaxID=3067274 RepID=UPI00273AE9FD|nr:hypothetical protein [Nonomuraea sp. G32]MDP4512072.1 hypothetical protein [Nonomuraea sp. G32]